MICVDLVRSHSAYDLLMKLKTRGIRSAEFSRALCKQSCFIYTIELFVCAVKQKMSQDVDAEVATTSLRVSLMCPVCSCDILYPHMIIASHPLCSVCSMKWSFCA